MARILYRPIIPRKMKINQFRKAIVPVLRKEGREIEKLYKRVSKNFESNVEYDKELTNTPDKLSMKVSTSDPRMVFLDLGTKKRWAVMSRDFVPKTQPRQLSSTRGSGGAVLRGRQAMQARGIAPRPGIKPRKFSIEVAKQRRKPFRINTQRAINDAAKKLF